MKKLDIIKRIAAIPPTDPSQMNDDQLEIY